MANREFSTGFAGQQRGVRPAGFKGNLRAGIAEADHEHWSRLELPRILVFL
jgi:hypothetical protein